MWWARWFTVITVQTAARWELKHWRSLFGDEINARGCRAIYRDKKGRYYRVGKV